VTARLRVIIGRLRHREARSAVAIQGSTAGVCHAALDRHASLTMTWFG